MTSTTSNPKYTIIIPTRNREKYLRFAVAGVLENKRDDVELIISDNHSQDDTPAYLETINDPRVRFIRPVTELAMSSHYEFALSHARGEWVTIIGDDDAIMPYLFDRLDELIAEFPQVSIVSSERAYYFWEGCQDLYGESVVVYRTGIKRALRSTKRDLLAALCGLRSCFDLPQIYTSCIVKRSVVQKIKIKSKGRFYHSIIPDMYSAVAMSLAEKNYLRVEEPLFWTGTSNASMGRSDRIYKDSALQSWENSNELPPMRLHPRISQELHILGIGSLYLYEALLNCPYITKFWQRKVISIIVYADVLRKLRWKLGRASFKKNHFEKKVFETSKSAGVSVTVLMLAKIALNTLDAFRWAVNLPVRVLRKINRFLKPNTLISSDRRRYKTISDASAEIVSLCIKR